jgi:hypothetical protein
MYALIRNEESFMSHSDYFLSSFVKNHALCRKYGAKFSTEKQQREDFFTISASAADDDVGGNLFKNFFLFAS